VVDEIQVLESIVVLLVSVPSLPTPDCTIDYSLCNQALWSAKRILLLMVIWVQFLASDLAALPILDYYIRWRLWERRIGVVDGLKIQIRPILTREQALVRPRGPTKCLLIELNTRILLVRIRLRQNQSSAELTRLHVSLSAKRGLHPAPVTRVALRRFSHWNTVGDRVDSVRESDICMPEFLTGCCLTPPMRSRG
jgi:hypothetical protein